MEEKYYIEIENIAGEVEKAELIGFVPSEIDEKTYVVLTKDETIGDEVNVIVGTLEQEEDVNIFTEIESDEEFEYVVSLMEKLPSEEL